MSPYPASRGSASPSRGRGVPIWDLLGGVLLIALTVVAVLALVLPMAVVLVVSFDAGPVLRFPPATFSFERYAALPQLEGFLDAIWVSVVIAAVTVAIDIALGVPAAISLVRGRFPGKPIIVGFLQSPLMVPGIVVGISILFFVSLVGVNVSIPLMIVSHVVITLPFVVRVTFARMESLDIHLEEAASVLGASRWQVFLHIVLPHLLPGIVGGSSLAFLLSFDNLPVSVFTAPVTEPPLPVYLFRLLLYEIDPIIAPIATLQIAITFVVLAIASKTLGVGGLARTER